MPLTNVAIKALKPQERPYKKADAHGLYLDVQPSGSKYWRWRYRFHGKQKLLALGVYPDVSLDEARAKREEARKLLKQDIDPAEARKQEKRIKKQTVANTFEAIAREWHEQQKGRWADTHANQLISRLESNLFPKLGNRPVADITAPELLEVVREIEKRGAVVLAQRALQTSGQIFRYAIATGRASSDPSRDLRGALKTVKSKNRSYLKESELPEFLEKLRAYDGEVLTKLALKMVVLTFVRSGELRGARWEEIDFDKAEWRIPAERMKMEEEHIVPLSQQMIALLEEIKLHSGDSEYLFPQQTRRDKIMSENTLLYAMYRMGYHSRATVHGFRSTASTILHEHGFRSDVIERQLAHGERNKVKAAYNHSQYLPERKEMMQWWANYLEGM